MADDAVLGLLLADWLKTAGIHKSDDSLASVLEQPAPLGIGDIVRFNHTLGQWLIWNGVRWRPDRTLGILDLVRKRALEWLDATDERGNQIMRGEDIKQLIPLFDMNKKAGVLKSLSARENIAMSGDEWDRDPYLVGFDNGIMNLEDGTWHPEPDPTWLVSKSVGVDFDIDASFSKNKGFDWFVDDIMGSDPEMVAYIKRLMGYSLLGLQSEQKFWMWVGRGSNGKGVLAKAISAALGDYADTPSDTLYMRTRAGAAPSSAARPDLMRLQALRFTYMSEPPGGQFNEEMIKSHTGEDSVLARDLYGKSTAMAKFTPTHKIVFLTNDPPRTDDVGVSMRRRVRVVHFDKDYSIKPDITLEERLRRPKERQAILNLMITEALAWIAEGLPEPQKVTDWSDEYISENDPMAAFIEDECVVGRGERGNSTLLFHAYIDWAARNNVEPKGHTGFANDIGRRFRRERIRTGTIFHGIRVKSAMEKAEGGEDDD